MCLVSDENRPRDRQLCTGASTIGGHQPERRVKPCPFSGPHDHLRAISCRCE